MLVCVLLLQGARKINYTQFLGLVELMAIEAGVESELNDKSALGLGIIQGDVGASMAASQWNTC